MIKSGISLKGVKVYPFVSEEDLLEYVSEKKQILVAINAEKILHATSQTQNIINRNIGYADGIGAVMALKKLGYKDAIRIPGCELWLKIIKTFYLKKSIYLVGGKQNVIEDTVLKLKKEFPGISILNYRNGYINSIDEKIALINDIKLQKPDIVFVAMGSPKQELLMEEMLKVNPAIYQGLGGSFDVYTGNVKRAPQWWINNNLEWAYRLLKQPFRLKRQIHLLKFLYLVWSGKMK